MNDEEIDVINQQGRQLKLDDAAASASLDLPGFLAKPEGVPACHGFPLVSETMTNGWCLGAITEYEDPEGCTSGDAYVIAPDGSRAGLVWDVGDGKIDEICPPDKSRWGLYQIWFKQPVQTTDDLVAAFRIVLPELQGIYRRL